MSNDINKLIDRALHSLAHCETLDERRAVLAAFAGAIAGNGGNHPAVIAGGPGAGGRAIVGEMIPSDIGGGGQAAPADWAAWSQANGIRHSYECERCRAEWSSFEGYRDHSCPNDPRSLPRR